MSEQEPVNRVWGMIEAAGWQVVIYLPSFMGQGLARVAILPPESTKWLPRPPEPILPSNVYFAYKHAPQGFEKEREMLTAIERGEEAGAALGFIVEAIALADSTPDAQPRKSGRL